MRVTRDLELSNITPLPEGRGRRITFPRPPFPLVGALVLGAFSCH